MQVYILQTRNLCMRLDRILCVILLFCFLSSYKKKHDIKHWDPATNKPMMGNAKTKKVQTVKTVKQVKQTHKVQEKNLKVMTKMKNVDNFCQIVKQEKIFPPKKDEKKGSKPSRNIYRSAQEELKQLLEKKQKIDLNETFTDLLGMTHKHQLFSKDVEERFCTHDIDVTEILNNFFSPLLLMMFLMTL